MSLSCTLTDYIRACFSGLWIESREHDEALTEISKLCRQENWRLPARSHLRLYRNRESGGVGSVANGRSLRRPCDAMGRRP
jgi:hypothetical protein